MKKLQIKRSKGKDQFFVITKGNELTGGKPYSIHSVHYSVSKAEEWIKNKEEN